MTTTNHVVPIKVYLGVFVALMVLLAATIVLARFDFGSHAFAIGASIAFVIAIMKAQLIVMYFMHVRYSPKLIWFVAIAGVLWLGILFAYTLSDYMSRGVFDPYGF